MVDPLLRPTRPPALISTAAAVDTDAAHHTPPPAPIRARLGIPRSSTPARTAPLSL